MSGHVKSIFFPDMDHGISAHRAATKSKNVLLNTPSSVRPKDKYKDTGISTDGYYLTHYMAKSCLPRFREEFGKCLGHVEVVSRKECTQGCEPLDCGQKMSRQDRGGRYVDSSRTPVV